MKRAAQAMPQELGRFTCLVGPLHDLELDVCRRRYVHVRRTPHHFRTHVLKKPTDFCVIVQSDAPVHMRTDTLTLPCGLEHMCVMPMELLPERTSMLRPKLLDHVGFIRALADFPNACCSEPRQQPLSQTKTDAPYISHIQHLHVFFHTVQYIHATRLRLPCSQARLQDIRSDTHTRFTLCLESNHVA